MSALSDAVLLLNPLVYWQMYEPTGTTNVDLSGNGHTLTHINNVTPSTDALIENDLTSASLFHNSIDSHASSLAVSPSLITDFSCFFAVQRTPGTTSVRSVFALGDLSDSVSSSSDIRFLYVYINYISNTSLNIAVSKRGTVAGANGIITSTSIKVDTDSPLMISLSYQLDDGTGQSRLQVYANARPASKLDNDVDLQIPVNFTTPVNYITGGRWLGTLGLRNEFNGNISDLAFFDTLLTDTQLFDLQVAGALSVNYDAKIGEIVPDVYWKFDETSGLIAADEELNLNGTISGDAAFDNPGLVPSDAGKSLIMGGATSKMITSGATLLNIDDFTIILTVKLQSVNPNGIFFKIIDLASVSTTVAYLGVSLSSARRLQITRRPTDGGSASASSFGLIIELDTPTQIIITRNSGVMIAWVNGVQSNNVTYSDQIVLNAAADFILGADYLAGVSTPKLVGFIDTTVFSHTGITEELASRLWLGHNASGAAPTPIVVNGTITESINAINFLVRSYNLETGSLTTSTSTTTPTFTLTYDPSEDGVPQFVTVLPDIGKRWTPITPYIAGDYIFPTDLTTTPHYWKALGVGNTGVTEPTWNTTPGSTTNDGSIIWEHQERLVQPKTQSPLIPKL
jgi:hypothetical protein